jgi:hypothetical protein
MDGSGSVDRCGAGEEVKRRLRNKQVAAANTKAYRARLKAKGVDPNAREKARYHAAKARGVVAERLREPKRLGRLAAVLRWNHMSSSNGSWRCESVWEYCAVFGLLPSVRRQESWADRGSVSVMADRWLAANDR